MMLDTDNNTAGTNDENKAAAPETPQSILEKRLAELNAKNTPQLSATPEEKATGDEINTNAIVVPAAIPPAAEAPVDSEVIEPASTDVSNTANMSDTQSDETTVTAISANIPPVTNNSEPINKEATASSEADAFPVADEAELYDDSVPHAMELLSTVGVIPATPEIVQNETENNPEPAAVSETTAANNLVPGIDDKGGIEDITASASPLPEDDQGEELVPETDYTTLSLTDLRQKLLAELKSASRKNAREIYEMHRQYDTKLAEERTDAIQRFEAENGTTDDFAYNAGPEHQALEQAFQQFRENRNREQRQDEEQRDKNGQRKKELLEQLRILVESPETKSSSDKIKAIQAEWKAIGAVPTGDSQQLWNSYHALLDIFYNNRSIFFELKELDRRKNLQLKIQLCERAEALANLPSINNALQELRHLHEEWKHLGPVPNDQRDAIWERFIQASEKIHARKKELIAEQKAKEGENLAKKEALLARMDAFQNFKTDRINDWRDKTEEIQKLKEEWDAIGLVPKDRADEVNKHFWSSYKSFFNHKNGFFKSLDELKIQNLRLKTELCEQAESLKESTDWDETKEKLIQLQKQWKTIGRVPDKFSDKLWNRFRAACNEFFDRKQNQVQAREAEINKAANAKTAYFEQIASRITQLNTEPGTIEELDTFRSTWDNFGTRGNAKQDERFYDLLQKYADSIPTLNNEERDSLILNLQITRIKQSPDASQRMQQKEQHIRKDIGQLENDIRTLKTNIEFFGRSKNAEKLREEYQARINEAEHKIQLLQRQLLAYRNA